MTLFKAMVLICIANFTTTFGKEIPKQRKTDQKQYTIRGILWSKGKTKIIVKKENYLEYAFIKNGESKKFKAIGPFVCGDDSILGIEYNLEIQHERPFILNYETWEKHILTVNGVIFDAGLTTDRSIYWLLEGYETGKEVETFVMLYTKNGEQLLRERIFKAGNSTLVLKGRKIEINLRLARSIDLIN
jgi:hypothetical protein